MHVGVLLVVAAITILVVRMGRSASRGPAGESPCVTRGLALAGLAIVLTQQVHSLGFEFDYAHKLPLHICDLTAIIGPLALLTRSRTLLTLTWFWGVVFCIWGLITPTLNEGLTTLTFWIFWLQHGLVTVCAVYVVAVLGYRPVWRDYVLTCLLTLAYIAVVLPLNLAFEGWNYGYVGKPDPSQWTPLDVLPPWPWRVLVMQALGAVMLAHAWLPFEVARWRKRRVRSRSRGA